MTVGSYTCAPVRACTPATPIPPSSSPAASRDLFVPALCIYVHCSCAIPSVFARCRRLVAYEFAGHTKRDRAQTKLHSTCAALIVARYDRSNQFIVHSSDYLRIPHMSSSCRYRTLLNSPQYFATEYRALLFYEKKACIFITISFF